jgi:hypothetical protein
MPEEHNLPLNPIEELLRALELASHGRHKEFDAIFKPDLSRITREQIRSLVNMAEDPSLPQEILEKLASHPSPEVREAVTENPNLSVESLNLLAKDECVDVRYALAENHNMPSNILYLLIEDENPYVSQRAEQTLERLRRSCRFAPKSLLVFGEQNDEDRGRLQHSV